MGCKSCKAPIGDPGVSINKLELCEFCRTPIGDPESHKMMCLGYQWSFDPWWHEPAVMMFWVIACIGVSYLLEAIFCWLIGRMT